MNKLVFPKIKKTSMRRIDLYPHTDIYVKEEYSHPSGSAKQRPATWMLEMLNFQFGRLIDAGSGSTALAEGDIAASKGIPFTAVVPESTNPARVKLIQSTHAEVILTPANEGIAGAIQYAQALEADGYGKFINQFTNPLNPESHRLTTASEIDQQFLVDIDAIVSCAGTGGTLYGTYMGLKDHGREVLPVLAKPMNNGKFSTQVPGVADGVGFANKQNMPGMHTELIDEAEVFQMMDRLHQMGISVGPSSALNVAAAAKVRKMMGPRSVVITFLMDRYERYVT
ncbi:MAG: pyridoxal-phosphate dependent enzyme [Zavarzinella sp.]